MESNGITYIKMRGMGTLVRAMPFIVCMSSIFVDRILIEFCTERVE